MGWSPKRKPSVAYRVMPDQEIVFLDMDSAVYYSSGEVGARIWDLCDGTRSAAAIIQMIVAEYEVPSDVAREDVVEFLRDLSGEGLLIGDQGER